MPSAVAYSEPRRICERGCGTAGHAVATERGMTKILFPTDFSPGSADAMRVAVRMAREAKAKIVVAHAWQIPALAYGSEPFSMAPALMQTMSDDAKHALAGVVDELKKQGLEATGNMSTGVSWSRLAEIADADPEIQLIVMGTHGRTGFKRVVLGSVAEKVVRHAPCSVLVSRGGDAKPFTDVLVPVDFSVSSQVAVDRAARLVSPGGSGITLLHVIEAPVAVNGEVFDLAFMRELDQSSTTALDEIAKRLERKVDVPVKTRVRIGYAGGQILTVLDDDPGFDLVVMGSHGRTGLKRVLLGSVAEKVVRHAPCSVMIARDRT